MNRCPCLQRVDEDAASVVAGDLGLLDERDGRHQRLNRGGELQPSVGLSNMNGTRSYHL